MFAGQNFRRFRYQYALLAADMQYMHCTVGAFLTLHAHASPSIYVDSSVQYLYIINIWR